MNREVHVRFWEGLAVRFRWATQLKSCLWRITNCLCQSALPGGLIFLPLQNSSSPLPERS